MSTESTFSGIPVYRHVTRYGDPEFLDNQDRCLLVLPLVVGSLGGRYVPRVLDGLWLVATTLPHWQGRIFRKGQIRLRPHTPVEDAAAPCLCALHMLTARTQTWMGSRVVRHMPSYKSEKRCCLDDTYHDTDKRIIIQLYDDNRGERHNEALHHAARRGVCLASDTASRSRL
jgi:hypothetical protein